MEGQKGKPSRVFCHRRKISTSWRTLFTCLPSNTQNTISISIHRRYRLGNLPIPIPHVNSHVTSDYFTAARRRVTQGTRRDYSRMTITRKTDTTSAATDYKRGRHNFADVSAMHHFYFFLYSALRQTPRASHLRRCKNLKDLKGAIQFDLEWGFIATGFG